MSTAIIVPCRNEAGEIASLLGAIHKNIKPGDQLIVVEGGSYDSTWEVVTRFAAEIPDVIVLQQSGKGKFNAVLNGIELATQDYVMIWDADGTVSIKDNLKIYNFNPSIETLITGDRLRGERDVGAMQFFNLIGNYVFAVWWGALLNQPPIDSLCGTKKFPRLLLAKSPSWLIEKDPYGDFAMLGTASLHNIPVVSFAVSYGARRYGKTNIQRWSGGFTLLRVILRISIRKFKIGR
jgi:glycosyltransferase involved in cell wall biosynthesis